MNPLDCYREIWLTDFEFNGKAGDTPSPVCLVAREYRTGRTLQLWTDELRARTKAPFPTDPDVLFVAYYSSAELGCFLSLGWSQPTRILDLYTEFRLVTSGQTPVAGHGLLGALTHYGLSGIGAGEKGGTRDLIPGGGAIQPR